MGLFGKFMSWLDEESNSNSDSENSREITFGNYNGVPMVWASISTISQTGDDMVTPTIEGVKGKSYILESVLFKAPFNEFDRMVKVENNIWENSTLRKYLNGEFYDSCFSDEEKSRIVPCSVKSYSNLKKDAYGEYYLDEIETIDKVYLPDDRLIFGRQVTNCYWTRMTMRDTDRCTYSLNNLSHAYDGNVKAKEKNDIRKVVIVDSQNIWKLLGMVDVMQDVRPVIFIKDE